MEKGEKGIGSAAVATTGTMLSDHSAIDASNPASSSTPKPPLIPSGFLVLAIGSAPVSPNHPFSLFSISNTFSLFSPSSPYVFCNACFTSSFSLLCWCEMELENYTFLQSSFILPDLVCFFPFRPYMKHSLQFITG